MTEAPAPLLLLDTAGLYFRAFFGKREPILAADGVRPVNAVRGLLDTISRFVEETGATHVACCWDNDWRPEWRVALIPSYKAHRVAGGAISPTEDESLPVGAGGRGAESGIAEVTDAALTIQVPMIAAVLEAAGIATVGVDGYEADDVVGTLATTATRPVLVVTGDRDLFQLVDDNVTVIYVGRSAVTPDVVDDAWLLAKYGVTGAQYVDFSVLRGDASDGLPGVKGIGEKTAARLLADHGDMEGILAAEGLNPRIAASLHDSVDYIARATEVVQVRRDLPLDADALAWPSVPADPEAFEALVAEFRLGGSANRLLAAMARGR